MANGRQAGGERWVGFSDCERHICTEGGTCPHCEIDRLTTENASLTEECTHLRDERNEWCRRNRIATAESRVRLHLLREAESFLCDPRAGVAANDLADRIRGAFPTVSGRHTHELTPSDKDVLDAALRKSVKPVADQSQEVAAPSRNCCGFHKDGGDTYAGCWEPDARQQEDV